jgi:cytochrome P450
MTRTLVEQFQQNEAAMDVRQRFMTTPMIVNDDSYLGRKMNQEELVDDMMAVAFAGSGTTSTTLTYMMYSLSRDPKRQDRLRKELQSCKDTLNDLKDLPFLNAVIKETMRVYPTIISTLPRVLDEPLTVEKYVVPTGTFVGMQNYVHHRDANLYPHPDEWWPERWLKDDANVRDMNAALTPFSLGPYNCIGQNLARAELYLAASKVFRKLRLTLNSDMTDWDMEMEDRFNIAPKGRRCWVDIEVLN